jgi:ferric-dicitrate binding protein FerR (iron transport regulator)
MKPDDRHAHEEAAVAAVVRRALPREPDQAARDRARAAVMAEWQAALAARRKPASRDSDPASHRRTGRAPRFALAASLLLAGVAALFAWFHAQQPPAGPLVARIEQGGLVADGALLGPGADVASGRVVAAASDTGALLRLGPALTLRLAAGTEARLASAARVELEQGRLFVDAGPGAGAALEIATLIGEVRHLGTQYEVVASGDAVEIAVREGRVRLASAAGPTIDASAGELLQARRDETPRRQVIADPEARFAWIAALPTPIAIEGLPLAAFLEWYARETGRTVVFASGDVEQEAAVDILRGSVDGLAPEAALDVVAASAGLAVERRAGTLLIHRAPAR